MHLSQLARTQGQKVAASCTDGTSLTYAALDGRSRRLATLFERRGLHPGDTVAILLPNTADYLAVAWGAQRAGLYFVPVNWHLTAAEAVYIVRDSGAKAVVASAALDALAADVVAHCDGLTLTLATGELEGYEDLDAALTAGSPERPDREPDGYYMFYSSGTTGRPKGIRPELPTAPFGTGLPVEAFLSALYGFGTDTTYLSTGPLYHAAPLGWSLGTQALGGTAVVLDRFDAEACLAAIERHRVTHAQFVPTMFSRLLKLPAAVRASYDLSSLRVVVHAAAPCPPEVKRQMINWLGPIVHEYYSGSEGNCFFAIDSVEWRAHPGSVGRPMRGVPHVLDEDGRELPTGEIGQVWIEGAGRFAYHNDPAKTAGAFNEQGWSTLGDLGRLDADGYLYLSDRRTDLILTGGVNVYPREIEDLLALHPGVADVAVIGVADDDMGQQVRAIVEPTPGYSGEAELAAELTALCTEHLARFKRPRRIDFVDELPRLPSGKILRRVLRDRYDTTDASSREPT